MSSKKAPAFHRFDCFEAVGIVAALQTFPNLHSHTLLIEHHIEQVWRNCSGKATPTQKDLRQWCLSLRGAEVEAAEDPREDVFLGRLIAPCPSDVPILSF